MAARAKRPEYAQLLTDCQRVYCEVRLGLVAEITADRIAEYAREPLPSLTRSGCSYLMQVRLPAPSRHETHHGTFTVPDLSNVQSTMSSRRILP